MSFGLEFGAKQSNSETTTQGVENSIIVKPLVKAGSSVKVLVKTERKQGVIPFVMKLRSSSGVVFERKGKMRAEYFFGQYVDYERV
jgi:hypothetical protein